MSTPMTNDEWISSQAPSLPDADPRSVRPRSGGHKSKFPALKEAVMRGFRACVFLIVPFALMVQAFAQDPVKARKDVEPATSSGKPETVKAGTSEKAAPSQAAKIEPRAPVKARKDIQSQKDAKSQAAKVGPVARLVSPDEDVTWKTGKTYMVEWSSFGIPAGSSGAVTCMREDRHETADKVTVPEGSNLYSLPEALRKSLMAQYAYEQGKQDEHFSKTIADKIGPSGKVPFTISSSGLNPKYYPVGSIVKLRVEVRLQVEGNGWKNYTDSHIINLELTKW
jgi:hypothetical protein